MSSRYTMASILTALFICIINGAQRETVFDSTNSFEWATGTWTLDGASFGTFPNCPSYAKCVRLGPNGGELYKYFSTLGYHSINAEWTMRSELVLTQPSGRRVKLFYSLSIETSDDPDPWITVSNNYASDSEITSYSAPLPDQTDDHDIVGIWFYLNAEDPGAAAYINDFKLTGIKITQPPTANPTIHPTLSTLKPSLSPTAFPTRFPTESPTQFPTKSPTKPPTSHPSKSPIATQYPSKYPTLNPMRPTKASNFTSIQISNCNAISIQISHIESNEANTNSNIISNTRSDRVYNKNNISDTKDGKQNVCCDSPNW
eukprot:648073_1